MKLEIDKKNDKVTLHLEDGAAKDLADLVQYGHDIIEKFAAEQKRSNFGEMMNAKKKQADKHPDPPDADPKRKNSG